MVPSIASSLLPRIAATLTAPAPSTTSLQRSSSRAIAAAVASSSTRIRSSRWVRRISSGMPPGRLTAMPSAIVSAVLASIGVPACIDSGIRRARRGLDADDLHVRLGFLDHQRHPRAQPAAADRHDDPREVGDVLEQFQPERALSGDDRLVVERMDERQSALLRPGQRGNQAGVDAVAADVNDRPGAARGFDLRHRRVAGHEHLAADPAGGRAGGERLRVVAGAGGDDAVGAAFLAQRGELRGHAADLERAGALQVLGLQDDRPARTLGERAGGQDRCPARDGLNRRACGFDVARGDAHSAMIASISTSAPIGRAATPMVVRAGGLCSK